MIEDAVSYFKELIDDTIKSGETSVFIPKDIYHFQSVEADELFDQVVNKIMFKNWDSDLFSARQRFIHLKDVNNISIDGSNSEIISHGMSIPFFIENCENLTLKNFKFNLHEKPYSEGIVINKKRKFFDVKIEFPEKVRTELPLHSWIEFDPETKLLGKKEFYFRNNKKIKQIEPGIFRIFKGKISRFFAPKVGKGLIIRHYISSHPAILIFNSKNIQIENITLESGHWGIIGHRTRDIKVRGYRVKPPENRIWSINADASHFISCSGLVDFENCYFEGQGDDALNIHTFYYYVNKILNKNTLETTIKKEQQDKIFDYPDPNDEIEFVKYKTLKPYARGKISDVMVLEKERKHVITVENKLPANFKEGDLIANVSKAASLRFIGNKIYNNRARGVLFQTIGANIENNEFKHCTGTGVYITCSKFWMEALSARDITIRNNKFIKCGGGPGTMAKCSGITIRPETLKFVPLSIRSAPDLYENIVIENNAIDGIGIKGIHIEAARDVKIIKNQITNCNPPIKVKKVSNLLIED